MNKQELLKKYNEEEKLLISKVLDKIKFVKGKNRVEITDFLNMYEQKIVKEILNKIQEENYILYGGFEAAERKLILFYPEKLENIFQEKIPNCNQYINTVRIELPNEMHGKYVHKNYLSGLMKLGVKREKIGDIIIHDNFCQVVVSEDICDFIIINLEKVSKNKVKVKEITVKDIIESEQNFKEISFTVSSLRLDSVIGGVYNLSRSESLKLIKGEKVHVDYEKIISPSKEIKTNSLISVRGHGRAIIEIGDMTKKGRIKIRAKIII